MQPPVVAEVGKNLPWLGVLSGAVAGFLLGNPIPFFIEKMYGFICYNEPLRLSQVMVHSFSQGKWLVLCLYALGGAFAGLVAGGALKRLKQHRQRLKTLDHEFELQVAALRHHYKNLTLGIHGFTNRIKRKLAHLDDEFRQCAKDDCPTYGKFHQDHEALKQHVVVLEEAAQRLSHTLNQELHFLKALASDSLVPEAHDFFQLLRESIKDLLELRFRDKGIRVAVNGRSWEDIQSSLILPCEPNALQVILQNVLTNAMQHGDSIEVEVAREAGSLRVNVKDNGPGMDVNLMKKQLRISSPGRPDATHLGLQVTLHLLEKIGGRLLVSSRPGEGATFILKIPI